jgi:hypothetical protein
VVLTLFSLFLLELDSSELVFDELAGEIVGQLKEYNLPEEGIAYVKEMLYFTVPGGINYEF